MTVDRKHGEIEYIDSRQTNIIDNSKHVKIKVGEGKTTCKSIQNVYLFRI